LWRKVESSEKVAVKNYKVERGKVTNKDIEETFVREIGLLFRLKYLFIFLLKDIVYQKEIKEQNW
jgi:hypothetical protein